MAKQFREGDWRSGYYRDQTWMMAMKLYDSVQFFHQLYAIPTGNSILAMGEEYLTIIFLYRMSIQTDPGVI
jgi:hypothetical protein